MTATLASRIASADAAYRRGQAHMTDQEFDALMAKLRDTQPDHPMLRMPGHALASTPSMLQCVLKASP